MEFLQQNLAETLMVAGIASLILELAVLGLSTFVFLFLGISLLLTGLAMMAGLLPDTGTAALWSNTILTALLALVLWKPMKVLQGRKQSGNVDSDFARKTFILEDDVDASGNSRMTYSGIAWQLKSQAPIARGTAVRISRMEVGVMWVEPDQESS
ncbi:MAG: NfeD family protein [Pseudomonadota bacterium]|nr:NfeD family protein [Pseudomonadota bacterium]